MTLLHMPHRHQLTGRATRAGLADGLSQGAGRLRGGVRRHREAGEPTARSPYHAVMRRGLHFLMVFVLILRGLAGTAMAAGVLPPLLPSGPQHAQPHSQHGPHAGKTVAAPHAVHAAHAADVPAVVAANTGVLDGSHPGHVHTSHPANAVSVPQCGECLDIPAAHEHHSVACSACEICHSAMLDVAALAMPMLSLMDSAQPITRVQFDSAPAALAVKPPIA